MSARKIFLFVVMVVFATSCKMEADMNAKAEMQKMGLAYSGKGDSITKTVSYKNTTLSKSYEATIAGEETQKICEQIRRKPFFKDELAELRSGLIQQSGNGSYAAKYAKGYVYSIKDKDGAGKQLRLDTIVNRLYLYKES